MEKVKNFVAHQPVAKKEKKEIRLQKCSIIYPDMKFLDIQFCLN